MRNDIPVEKDPEPFRYLSESNEASFTYQRVAGSTGLINDPIHPHHSLVKVAKKAKLVGKGQSAFVHKIRLPEGETYGKLQGRDVVVKQPLDGERDQPEEFDREVAILRHLQIPFICYRFQKNGRPSTDEKEIKDTILIVPYYPGKSLHQFIRDNRNTLGGEIKILKAFIAYCEAIRELHLRGVVLGDVNLGSCLLTEDEDGMLSARLVDFGKGSIVGDPHYGEAYTFDLQYADTIPVHFAPERFSKRDLPLQAEYSQDTYGIAGLFRFLINLKPGPEKENVSLSSLYRGDKTLLPLLEGCLKEAPEERTPLPQFVEGLKGILAEKQWALELRQLKILVNRVVNLSNIKSARSSKRLDKEKAVGLIAGLNATLAYFKKGRSLLEAIQLGYAYNPKKGLSGTRTYINIIEGRAVLETIQFQLRSGRIDETLSKRKNPCYDHFFKLPFTKTPDTKSMKTIKAVTDQLEAFQLNGERSLGKEHSQIVQDLEDFVKNNAKIKITSQTEAETSQMDVSDSPDFGGDEVAEVAVPATREEEFREVSMIAGKRENVISFKYP